MTHRLLSLMLVPLLAAPLGAQGVQEVRGGASNGFTLSDGEPVSFMLEHASRLDLTDGQRTALIDIRRRLRRLNAPYMVQLDSLRRQMGISLQPTRLFDGDDRLKLERFDKAAEPITTIIRTNNDGAKVQARAVLDSLQRVTLDSIRDAAGDRVRGRGR
jgi:hypothetical protein